MLDLLPTPAHTKPAAANSAVGFDIPYHKAHQRPCFHVGAFCLLGIMFLCCVRCSPVYDGRHGEPSGSPVLVQVCQLVSFVSLFDIRAANSNDHKEFNMSNTTLPANVRFGTTDLTVIEKDGIPYLTATDLAKALGYRATDAVSRIYRRNANEFTDDMTLTVNLTVNNYRGGEKDVRIFNPRGCHLIAMLSRTEKARAFRRWVLDVLESLNTPQGLMPPPAHPDMAHHMALAASQALYQALMDAQADRTVPLHGRRFITIVQAPPHRIATARLTELSRKVPLLSPQSLAQQIKSGEAILPRQDLVALNQATYHQLISKGVV